jgi:6-phosphogluconolactonase
MRSAKKSVVTALTLSLVISFWLAGCGPTNNLPSEVGEFLYVANEADGVISEYSINTTTGALTNVGPFNALPGGGLFLMAMHPTNEFIYAADQNDSDVLGFDIGDGSFSGLIFERNSDAPAINAPRVEALTPHGGYLYATNSGGTAAEVSEYVIDLKTGALTSNGTAPCGQIPVGVAVEPSEIFAYVVNLFDQTVSQYIVRVPGKLEANGTFTLPFNEDSTPELVATTLPAANVENTECAYVTDDGLGVLHEFTINFPSGTLTQLPDVSANSLPFGIAIHPTGRFIYTASAKSNSISVFTQSSTTACTAPLTSQVTSSLAVVTNLSGPISIAVEPTGQFAYTANSSNGTVGEYSINTTTGALTPIGEVNTETPPNPGSLPISAVTTY